MGDMGGGGEKESMMSVEEVLYKPMLLKAEV